MKLHPRLATGLFSIICSFLIVFIMKFFSLSDDFYYLALGVIVTIDFFVYDIFDKEYEKSKSEKSDFDEDDISADDDSHSN